MVKKKLAKVEPPIQEHVEDTIPGLTDSGLTLKQEMFVHEFVIDMNATRAYKAAYGTTNQRTAEVNGNKLLSNAEVRSYIKEMIIEKFKRKNADGQWVVDRLFELVDRCMEREPVMIRVGRNFVQEEDLRTDPATGKIFKVGVWKFDSVGANMALASLAKYFKLFDDKPAALPNVPVQKIEIIIGKKPEDELPEASIV